MTEICHFAEQTGFGVLGLTISPVKGPEGNIEFRAHLRRGAESIRRDEAQVVQAAHQTLGGSV